MILKIVIVIIGSHQNGIASKSRDDLAPAGRIRCTNIPLRGRLVCGFIARDGDRLADNCLLGHLIGGDLLVKNDRIGIQNNGNQKTEA